MVNVMTVSGLFSGEESIYSCLSEEDICEYEDNIKYFDTLKRTRVDYLNSSGTSVSLKKTKIDSEIKLKINAISSEAVSLNQHPILFDIALSVLEEDRAKEINDFVLDILDQKFDSPGIIEFLNTLGINNFEDQELVMSSKCEDLAKMGDLFDKVFPGYFITSKVASYKKIKKDLEEHSEKLNIINKIFTNGLVFKIFENKISIEHASKYNFDEVKIAIEIKKNLQNGIKLAILFDCTAIINFLSNSSLDNLRLLIKLAAYHGKEELVLDLLSKSSSNLMVAIEGSIEGAIEGDKIEIVKQILKKNLEISSEGLKEVIEIIVIKQKDCLVLDILNKFPENLGDFFFCAIKFNKEKMIDTLFDKYNIDIHQFTKKGIELAFKVGAKKSIIDSILKHSPEILVIDAIILGCLFGRDDLVEKIIFKHKVSSPLYLKQFVIAAADKGHENLIKSLLSLFRTYSKLEIEELTMYLVSKSKGNLDLEFFQDKSKVDNEIIKFISYKDVNTKLQKAILENKEPLFLEILAENQFNVRSGFSYAFNSNKDSFVRAVLSLYSDKVSDILKDFIKLSLTRDNVTMINALLSQLNEKKNYLGELFFNSVCFNKKKLVEFFLSSHDDYLKEDIKKSIEWLVKVKNKPILNFILDKYPEYSGLAFVSAASNGEKSIFGDVLSKYKTISEDDFSKALIVSAINGHQDIVSFLLPKSLKDLEEVFVSASSNGRIDIVRNILLKNKDDAILYLTKAVIAAAVNGHIDVVSFLLPKSLGDLEKVFLSAASNGRIDIVRNIFSGYQDDAKLHLTKAVMAASVNGHIDVVNFLLPKSLDDLEEVFLSAASNGKTDMIKNILLGFRKISNYHLVKAIKSAAKNGHGEVINVIVEKLPKDLGLNIFSDFLFGKIESSIEFIPDKVYVIARQLKEFIKFAVEKESEYLVLKLLSKNEENIYSALSYAFNLNKDKLVKAILLSYFSKLSDYFKFYLKSAIDDEKITMLDVFLSMSNDYVEESFSYSVLNNKKEIFEHILSKYNDLLFKDSGKLVDFIVQNASESIIDCFLSKYPEKLELVVISAAFYGKEELIKKNFSEFPDISESVLKNAILNASKNGHKAIVDCILTKLPTFLKLAVFGASVGGQLDMIKELLPYGVSIKTKNLEKSIKVAIEKGHKDVVLELLLKDPKLINISFYTAVACNKTDIVEILLLNYKSFLVVDLKKTIEFLVEKENIHMLNFILLKSPENLGIAVISAISHEKKDLVKDLLPEGKSIPKEYLSSAIQMAKDKGYSDIFSYLSLKQSDEESFFNEILLNLS